MVIKITDFDRIIDRLNTESVKWDSLLDVYGDKDLIPLWVADMDFPAPKEVTEAIKERVLHPIYGYSKAGEDYYNAIISWNKRQHNFDISREWIVHSPGVVPALNWLIQALTSKEDKIIIQEPVYHPFKHAILANDRVPLNNQLLYQDGEYKMDLEGLESIIDDKTRMLILCNPHNPVGRVWTEKELRALGDICFKHNILVVSDEIHGDLIYKGYKHIPFASLGENFADKSIICNAPSKTFNLAGLQCSNIIIKNTDIREKFLSHLDKMHIQGPTPFSIAGVKAAYNHGDIWLQELLDYLEENLNFMINYLKDNLPKIKVIRPQGTYLVWVDFTPLNLTREEINHKLIEEAGVALNDGLMFGESGDRFQRFNIACPRTTLKEALARIAETFRDI